jgi:hypothetical protein
MPDTSTKDGYPQEMQTNHLSQFLLASKVLPLLQKAAAKSGSARIVTHSSAARLYGANVNKDHYGKNGGNLGGDKARWERYHQTKLANVCFMQALKVLCSDLSTFGITFVPFLSQPDQSFSEACVCVHHAVSLNPDSLASKRVVACHVVLAPFIWFRSIRFVVYGPPLEPCGGFSFHFHSTSCVQYKVMFSMQPQTAALCS